MTSVPALVGLRSVAGAGQRWHVVVYLAVIAPLLFGFGTSGYAPFQEHVLGATSTVEVWPATWKLDGGLLLPGASATAAFVVRNPSVGPIRVSFVIASSGRTDRDLADALYVVLKTAGHGCDRFDGRVLARGPLRGFKLGDATPGHQAGDRILGPGRSETFCLRTLMPAMTGNEFQGVSTVLRLTASAEGIAER